MNAGSCFRLTLLLLIAALGAFASACTSSSSSETSTTTDSSATLTAQTVAETSPPDPAAPTAIEAGREDRTVAQKLRDASRETRVEQALRRASDLRVFPFRPTVVNGHLILRGDVNTADQYRKAERIARQVDGITAVTNRLTMGGRPVTEARLSSSDEAPSEGENAAVYHTVRQGDTLWDIARQYRASIEQIRNLNDLRSSALRPGQRIRVR